MALSREVIELGELFEELDRDRNGQIPSRRAVRMLPLGGGVDIGLFLKFGGAPPFWSPLKTLNLLWKEVQVLLYKAGLQLILVYELYGCFYEWGVLQRGFGG